MSSIMDQFLEEGNIGVLIRCCRRHNVPDEKIIEDIKGLFNKTDEQAKHYIRYEDEQCQEMISKKVEEYMKLPYSMEIYPDAVEGGYTVAFPDLPGCLTCGGTLEKAIENSEDAKRCWFEAAIEDGVQIKEPDDLNDYSGEVTMKMPKSLHRALSEQSRRENVTISKFCTYLLSRDNTLYVTDNTDECLKMPTRKKAFQEGYRQGYANSMAKRVLRELGSKGKVPENLYDRIMAETDVDVLDRWDELARNASSIKEFEKAEYNDQRTKGTNIWFFAEDILQMGRRQGMLDELVLLYRKSLVPKKRLLLLR